MGDDILKYYLGIDLGGTNIAVGIVDKNYNIVSKISVATNANRPFKAIIEDIAITCKQVISSANLSLSDIEYFGAGVPSSINPITNNLIFANNLNWKDVNFIDEFKKHINHTIFVANDADCAAYAETICGAGKNYSNALMITLGTGIGGGIVLNKRIFTGGNGFGCEPGHFTLVMDGVECTCGRRGCFEAYASVTALIRQTIEMMALYPNSVLYKLCENKFSKVNGKLAFDAAKLDDIAGKKIVSNYFNYLAAGISSLNTLLLPEIIIIGGGISNQGDYLLEPLRKRFLELAPSSGLLNPPIIEKACLGNDAGIIGAALLGIKY